MRSEPVRGRAEQRIVDGTSWRDFCRALEEAGQVVLRAGTPDAPLDRAEGYRYLTRLLRAGLEAQLEYADPRHPGFFQLANETIKIGNDNPDNVYHNCNVSGRYDYVISGTRGTVPYLSFGTKSGGYESDGSMAPTGQLGSSELAVEPDGTFLIQVSADRKPGNWLPMAAHTTSMVVRQTFHDRAAEEPARYRITCTNPDAPDGLRPDDLEPALERAVAFVKGTANLFVDWMLDYERHLNQLPSDDQEKCQRAGGDANIHYLQGYWKLEPDEALLVEARTLPNCSTWNFQIGNFWMESLDYRHHRIHLNKQSAHYEPDGTVRIVVTEHDPGPRWPNWLETCGHHCGGMLFRWVEADAHPPVETRVVSVHELERLRAR